MSGLALLVGAIIFFGSGILSQRSEKILLYFNESVNGLEVGAPVKFKGVAIGNVSDIRIQYNQRADSDAIPVFIEIHTAKLRDRLGVTNLDLANPEHLKSQIRLGLRGKLQAQSYVTGMLFIELDYYENAPIVFYQAEKHFLEIPTVSSNVQEIMHSVTELLADLNGMDFSAISRELEGALRELRIGLKSMEFETLNKNVIAASQGLAEFIKSDDLKNSLSNVEGITADVLEITKQFKNDFAPLTIQIRDSLATVEAAMLEIQKTVRPESSMRVQLETTLREFSRAASAMRTLAEYLERNPSALLRGKPQETDKE